MGSTIQSYPLALIEHLPSLDNVASAVIATAGAMGIASSLYFRRHEPTIGSFATCVAFVAAIARLATAPWNYSLISSPVFPTVASVTAFVAGLGLSILHYRLLSSTHPLHDIPGPVFARATKWWLLRKVVGGNIRDDLSAAHAKYGKIVRIAPNEISIADFEAVLPIHGAKSWIRGTSYNATVYSKNGVDVENASMLNLIDHATHTPRRRIWDKAFTIGSLRDYEPMVMNRIAQLCEQFDAREGKVFDLNEFMGYLVFDVTSDLAYGGGTSFLKQANDGDGLLRGVIAALRFQGRTMAIPWLSDLMKYLPLAKKSAPFIKYSKDRFVQRIKDGNPSGGKDFLYHLNNEGSEGGRAQLSTTAMASDAALIMAAGSDTTRLAISIIFMYMLRFPALYKQLQAELDKVVAHQEMTSVRGLDLPPHDLIKAIPLLDAYIDEALRLHPPLSIEPMREAPEGGVLVAGKFLPGGTQVRVLTHIIQTDPENFSRPLEYLPERWLKSADPALVFNKAAFFPFLFGPFHCVGKQFAYQEMRLFISAILLRYDMEFCPGFDSHAWVRSVEDNGTLLEIHQPLEVILTRRKV